MASKYAIILLLVSATIVALVHSAPNDVILGDRVPGDYMLQREFLKVPSKWLKIINERKTFNGDGRSIITQVKLLDQNKKGKGASARVANGGPGMGHVTVDFRSKRGHSIEYIIELYGK